jgi:hypothetical protein
MTLASLLVAILALAIAVMSAVHTDVRKKRNPTPILRAEMKRLVPAAPTANRSTKMG